MKKKFMITAAIAALTLAGGYLGKAAADRTYGLSDIQLANAEALAQGEASYIPPCHPAPNYQCVFHIFLPDGTMGSVTLYNMKPIL